MAEGTRRCPPLRAGQRPQGHARTTVRALAGPAAGAASAPARKRAALAQRCPTLPPTHLRRARPQPRFLHHSRVAAWDERKAPLRLAQHVPSASLHDRALRRQSPLATAFLLCLPVGIWSAALPGLAAAGAQDQQPRLTELYEFVFGLDFLPSIH